LEIEADKNKRQYVRAKVPENTKLYLITDGNGKKSRIKFKINNLSASGICLETGNYPFRLNEKYHLAIVIFLKNTINVIKIYHMDAYPKHNTNNKTGFFMVRRIKDK
jgi:c-di-GMP-binding flagellar brake protein YcgR